MIERRAPLLSVRPISARIYGRFRRDTLTADALEAVELSPSSKRASPPVIALPDEEKRILASHVEATEDHNRAILERHPFTLHGPTRMFRMRDIIIADGTLLGRRNLRAIRTQPRKAMLVGMAERFEGAMFCSDFGTENFFAHWLIDGASHELIARQQNMMPLVFDRPAWIHEPGYRSMLKTSVRATSFATVRDLWVVEDSALNDGRIERMQDIRNRLRDVHAAEGPPRVFISRGVHARGRTMINEIEVREALVAHGFAILEPEHSTAEHIVATLRSARIIVSVEGSAIAHAAMVAPAHARLLIIQPPRNFNMLWKVVGDALSMTTGYTVGVPQDGSSFTQPIDRLLATLKLLERA